MARFIVTHTSAAEATQEQFLESARNVMASPGTRCGMAELVVVPGDGETSLRVGGPR